ncbi:hypothetical protein BJ508DRAFT_367769 [Ascobolus immersus RN42]|uniref:Uncharacterized protein n=1 Tax=Ascobolus immersus RN42 TaxID=1160509 RepID=A0A3N4HH85_ASCIM|nr:hypothetical protein BJ508DRAFT_367769 [Ascobolus immersus RN42]
MNHGIYQYVWEHAAWLAFQKENSKAISHLREQRRNGKSLWKATPLVLVALIQQMPSELERCLTANICDLSGLMIGAAVKVVAYWKEFSLSGQVSEEVMAWGPGQIISVISIIGLILTWLTAFYDEKMNSELVDLNLPCEQRAAACSTSSASPGVTGQDNSNSSIGVATLQSRATFPSSGEQYDGKALRLDPLPATLGMSELYAAKNRDGDPCFSVSEIYELPESTLFEKIKFCLALTTPTTLSGWFNILGHVSAAYPNKSQLETSDDEEASRGILRLNLSSLGSMSLVRKRARERWNEADTKRLVLVAEKGQITQEFETARAELEAAKLRLAGATAGIEQIKAAQKVLKGIEFGGHTICQMYLEEEVVRDVEAGCNEKIRLRRLIASKGSTSSLVSGRGAFQGTISPTQRRGLDHSSLSCGLGR